jgi:uncharacterized membrane protein YcaP (DUF421 family)
MAMDRLECLSYLKHMWTHMFALNLPLVEKILRPAIVYTFIVIMLRVFGKRELAQLNPFDLVVLLSVSNTVQNAIIGDDNSVTGGLIGAFTLFAVNYIVIRFLFKHRRLDEILEGTPTRLVEDGKLCHGGLAKELLSESELLTVAHRQGFANLDEVQHCTLEPGGTFYFEAKEPRPHEVHHAAVMKQLHELSGQIDDLRQLVRTR